MGIKTQFPDNNNDNNNNNNFNATQMDEQSYKMLKKMKKFSFDLSIFLNQEIEYYENEKFNGKSNMCEIEDNGDKDDDEIRDEFSEKWAESLSILDPTFCTLSPSFDSSHLVTSETYHIHPTHIIKANDALLNKEETSSVNENKNEIIQIPVGESVTVRAEFRNKLSTKINLTDLRLEIAPANEFTVTPCSATVCSNGRIDVLIQSLAVRTGSYKVRAQNINKMIMQFKYFFRLIIDNVDFSIQNNRTCILKGTDKYVCKCYF